MVNVKVKDTSERLSKAIDSLQNAVESNNPDKMMKRDSTIQRFEYTIELFWKFLRRYLLNMGNKEEELKFPKLVLIEAYKAHLIDDEYTWIDMLQDRNKTSHMYDEDEINEIYKNIVERYYPAMQKSYNQLKDKI